MSKKYIVNIAISITLILLTGLSIGYIIGYYNSTKNHFPEIKFVDEINQGITTIKLMEVVNGKLVGEISGREAWLVYSADDILELKKGDKFEIPTSKIQLKSYYQIQNIPKDTQFIASKNGKYYYSIFDKSALGISEKNRIYFNNSKDAEIKGYTRK